jgi:hypothetical protein
VLWKKIVSLVWTEWSEFGIQSIFFPEGGMGLDSRPKRGCLLTLAYYSFPRWYEFGERWRNDMTGENRRTRRNTCPSATLSTTNPTWIDLGTNPGLRGERPATNDLSHGTAPYKALIVYNNVRWLIRGLCTSSWVFGLSLHVFDQW